MKIMLIGTYHRDRGIEEELKQIQQLIGTNNMILPTVFATSPNDFRRQIQDYKSDLIHISSEAQSDGIIKLPSFDDDKTIDRLKPEELASFFKDANVNCVVLNFCYSNKFAELIANHVPYVIGIDGDIETTAAVEFSKAFYGSLGGSPLNRTIIDEAFNKGKNAALPTNGNIDRYKNYTKFRLIALKADKNGKYVSVKDHGGNEVVADAEKIDDWETFTLITLLKNLEDPKVAKVALLAFNGQYVSVDLRAGYDGKIVANRHKIDDWETFKLIELEDNKIALLACNNNRYVCADLDDKGKLIANRPDRNDWETFLIEDVPPKTEKPS